MEYGPIFGIDEKKDFTPASLLKVPLMLTYFRLAENTPALLEEKLEIQELDPIFKPFFRSTHFIQENTPYSIEELIRAMIVYSDNDAYFALLEHLQRISPSEDLLLETYHELGMISPEDELDATLSTKNYASIFRLLYNISYLSKEYSEKALSMLAASDFNQGLAAGVPSGIPVANKFGERIDYTNNQKQLHDCGIVYYPNNPFLLCVMVRGNNFIELAEIIKIISSMVYAEVDSRRL